MIERHDTSGPSAPCTCDLAGSDGRRYGTLIGSVPTGAPTGPYCRAYFVTNDCPLHGMYDEAVLHPGGAGKIKSLCSDEFAERHKWHFNQGRDAFQQSHPWLVPTHASVEAVYSDPKLHPDHLTRNLERDEEIYRAVALGQPVPDADPPSDNARTIASPVVINKPRQEMLQAIGGRRTGKTSAFRRALESNAAYSAIVLPDGRHAKIMYRESTPQGQRIKLAIEDEISEFVVSDEQIAQAPPDVLQAIVQQVLNMRR